MIFLKGLVAISGTVFTLVVATIVFVFLKVRAEANSIPGPVGYDIKVVWIWLFYSPIYWLVVLALLGLCVGVFRNWVFSH